MFLLIYCNEEILQGEALSFNSELQIWERASNNNQPLCIARKNAEARNDKFAVEAVFSGAVFARASRSIPIEGGALQVENGGVYVDNSVSNCGIICPQIIDNENQRNQGDLVQVVIG